MKDFILDLAKKAGQITLNHLGNAKISKKGPKDVVTDADVEVEKFVTQKIKEKYPEHNIVGEEALYDSTDSHYTWFIDPIDGTSNYSHGDPNFAVSIGVAKDGILIYGCVYIPLYNWMFFAELNKGAELNGEKINVSKIDQLTDAMVQLQISHLPDTVDASLEIFKYFTLKADRARDLGFCAGQLAYVGAGKSDSMIKAYQNSWDIAAGILIVTEAGGVVSDFFGQPITLTNDHNKRSHVVASNGLLQKEILNSLHVDLKHVLEQNKEVLK